MITIKRLALLTLIITYVLIVFGGFVASSESGMGCGPEWPLCNGKVIPVLEGETLIEFAHRVIGLIVVILASALFYFVKKTKSAASLRKAANWMVGILAFQVIAGAVVVVFDLPSSIVTLHLLIAMIFLVPLLSMYRFSQLTQFKGSLSYSKQKSIVMNVNVLLGLLLLTIVLGAYVKHQSYGIACGWLDCGGTLVPQNQPQLLQTFHRLVAVITAIYTMIVTIMSFKKGWGKRIQTRLALSTLIVLVQLLTGIFTIYSLISIPWAVIHLAVGTVLFIVLADTRVFMGGRAGTVHLSPIADARKQENRP